MYVGYILRTTKYDETINYYNRKSKMLLVSKLSTSTSKPSHHSQTAYFERKTAAAQLRLNLRDLHAQTQTVSDCRAWMWQNGLLAVHMTCHKCHGSMVESEYQRVTDKVTWRCPPKNCHINTSIRKGSFLVRSGLPLHKLIDLIYYWSLELPHVTIIMWMYLERTAGSHTRRHGDQW